MRARECTVEDVALLAQMNKYSLEDDDPEANLSLPHLENRMRDYINSGYKAFLFLIDEKVIGYALSNGAKPPIYLRQFFIVRDERRKGYGKQAFHLLLDLLGIQESDIDVYTWNDSTVRFWRTLGVDTRRNNKIVYTS